MLSVVAAGIATVNGKMVAASESGRRWKLASMAQRLFAAGASHLRIRWASRVIRDEPCTFLDVI